ncbi:MAG: trimethylamine methyltransferase family protein, partial [Phycisphaerae bacterium]|nr:trimethylamine methyltransferase family protein [Phycisphaerae bacterium]
MFKDYNSKVQPRVEFLNEDQVEAIHNAALTILEKTGIVVHCDKTVELLFSLGCKVFDKNRVCIPPYLVEEAVQSTPAVVHIYNRKGERAMALGERKSYWGTGSDTPFTLDYITEQKRQTSLEDVKNFAITLDALKNMDFLMCMAVANEISPSIADKHHFITMASHTTKPLVFTASSRENLKDIYEIACDIAGGEQEFQQKPFIILYTQPPAPLIPPQDSLEKMLFAVEHGIPVIYSAATTAGQNGPVTLAGAAALSVARNLSGFVIAQLKRKGAKMITTLHSSSMDPRTAIHTYSSPEHISGQ